MILYLSYWIELHTVLVLYCITSGAALVSGLASGVWGGLDDLKGVAHGGDRTVWMPGIREEQRLNLVRVPIKIATVYIKLIGIIILECYIVIYY